jgi:hypothetical protein
MIYFIQAGDDGPIKIGYAANVDQSITKWQGGSPVPLRLLTTLDGSLGVEVYLQAKFLHLRQSRKWFKVSQEILDFIENPLLPTDLLANQPSTYDKKILTKLNQFLLRIKYQSRVGVEWQDIAGELGITTERLHKLRYEGFYEELHWEQIQRLAKLLTMRSWELVRLVEEDQLPDEIDSQQLML